MPVLVKDHERILNSTTRTQCLHRKEKYNVLSLRMNQANRSLRIAPRIRERANCEEMSPRQGKSAEVDRNDLEHARSQCFNYR